MSKSEERVKAAKTLMSSLDDDVSLEESAAAAVDIWPDGGDCIEDMRDDCGARIVEEEMTEMGDGYCISRELPVMLDEGATMPTRAHARDAGLDLYAPDGLEPAEIGPGRSLLVDTGVHVGLPAGCVGMVFPRSGLSLRHGVVAATGVVDAGFTGPVLVRLYNHSRATAVRIRPGDRVAQLVVMPVWLLAPVEVESLGESERGEAGYGSTGR